MKANMALFEGHQIRRIYDEEAEIWWFSVIDIVQVLTQQVDHQAARNYWKVLKNRLKKEGSEVVTNCNRLKMTATDGKQRMTDVATAETLLRLVQSVPSPNEIVCGVYSWLVGGRLERGAGSGELPPAFTAVFA